MVDSEGLTHGCVVGVGEALVHPLPHEHPAVIGKGALDDLAVVLFQLFSGLRRQMKGHRWFVGCYHTESMK